MTLFRGRGNIKNSFVGIAAWREKEKDRIIMTLGKIEQT